MTALPNRDDIGGNPSRATAKNAFGQLWDYISERFSAGSASEAEKAATRGALEAGRALQPISAAVAGNALTITLNPTALEFRHPTLSNGTVNTRVVSAPITLTVSNGSTLGTVNGQPATLAVVALDNAGTVELAVTNLNGTVVLDESVLFTTTAEGGVGGADSANILYSATARTNVPMRLLGFISLTQVLAGVWASAPTAVQGAGGNLPRMQRPDPGLSGPGVGQFWQNVAGSRAQSTNYTNNTGRTIAVCVVGIVSASGTLLLTLDGATFQAYNNATTSPTTSTVYALVPPGSTYSVSGASSLSSWRELR